MNCPTAGTLNPFVGYGASFNSGNDDCGAMYSIGPCGTLLLGRVPAELLCAEVEPLCVDGELFDGKFDDAELELEPPDEFCEVEIQYANKVTSLFNPGE